MIIKGSDIIFYISIIINNKYTKSNKPKSKKRVKSPKLYPQKSKYHLRGNKMITTNIILLFLKIVKYILTFSIKIINKDKYKKLHYILDKPDSFLTLIVNILSIIDFD